MLFTASSKYLCTLRYKVRFTAGSSFGARPARRLNDVSRKVTMRGKGGTPSERTVWKMIKPRILVCCFFLLLPCLSSAAPVNASCARMPTEKDRRRVERLIRALSHPEFEERECATELLVREGSAVLKYLKPLFRSGNPEIVYRARRIFQEIRGFTPETEERVLRLVEKLNDGPVGEARNEVREIVEAGPFYYAEGYHQQYLSKNPHGYCGIGGTGVSCPVGLRA